MGGRIKLRDREIILDYLGGFNVITRILVRGRQVGWRPESRGRGSNMMVETKVGGI